MQFEELKKQLNSQVLVVTFKKANGDVREMECTSNLQLIPPSQWPTGKNELSEEAATKTIRVFDVKAQGWRSFVFDRVISVK